MNTVNVGRDGTDDALDDNGRAVLWLRAVADRICAEAGTDQGQLDEDSLRPAARMLRELRDSLRLLAAEATKDLRPPAVAQELTRPEAIATLNALAAVWPELVWPEGRRPSRAYRVHGTVGALAVGLIAHQGVELLTGPGRDKLRPCLAPNCLLFFVKDHARREWCSPGCGNRARVARHYERHHDAGRQ